MPPFSSEGSKLSFFHLSNSSYTQYCQQSDTKMSNLCSSLHHTLFLFNQLKPTKIEDHSQSRINWTSPQSCQMLKEILAGLFWSLKEQSEKPLITFWKFSSPSSPFVFLDPSWFIKFLNNSLSIHLIYSKYIMICNWKLVLSMLASIHWVTHSDTACVCNAQTFLAQTSCNRPFSQQLFWHENGKIMLVMTSVANNCICQLGYSNRVPTIVQVLGIITLVIIATLAFLKHF